LALAALAVVASVPPGWRLACAALNVENNDTDAAA
jgi:hypothetical protein